MSSASSGSQTEFLAPAECWGYLRASYIGRLAVINGNIPEIFPVNFMTVGQTLVIRTGPGTKLRALLKGGTAAFEADGMNAYSNKVWSVVVKGVPGPFQGDEADLEAAGPDREPWQQGLKEHLVQITPSEVSGRRFAVSPRTRWWPPQDFSADWL
ncbi:pyridoxamine 5'-phosphate oxidase-like protein [Arthrobacter sp. SLBN-100]|uniref:pyridoxamine 5'-phosphate oxidase family protein n=1 Tax=Arthrobacter sp. SLBN-100 TaxID=2768450 RepID=UPI001152580B|nr:pyridoxamine 5'-phosphate oxidase family protein [Arthrobacter sp. SLBN-100]TQJ66378.1 pyridoxamine 5'-phosphate oxidase-like protein [Arthrobacter sp. SLBN-100]